MKNVSFFDSFNINKSIQEGADDFFRECGYPSKPSDRVEMATTKAKRKFNLLDGIRKLLIIIRP